MKQCIEKISFYVQTIRFNAPSKEKEMADLALSFFQDSLNTRIALLEDYLHEYKEEGDEVDGAFLVYEALDGACKVLEADKEDIKKSENKTVFTKYMNILLCLLRDERSFYKSIYEAN